MKPARRFDRSGPRPTSSTRCPSMACAAVHRRSLDEGGARREGRRSRRWRHPRSGVTSELQMSADAARLRFMLDRSKAAELAAVLDWYREMGAEEAIGEAPIDWLQRGDVAPGNGFASLLL